MTKKTILQAILILLLLAGYFFFTYCALFGRQLPMLGTLVVIGIAMLCWPGQWPERLGLRADARGIVLAAALAAVTFLAAFLVLRYTAESGGLSFGFDPDQTLWKIVSIFFQSLNEELVLGALLLLFLKRRFPKVPRFLISVIVAVVFSLLHLAFYLCVAESNRGLLGPVVLLNLFLAGVIRNNFIVYLDQVYQAWAVHCAWNIVFLGPFIMEKMNEPQKFNAFMGSWLLTGVFLFIIVAGGFVIFLLRRRERGGRAGINGLARRNGL